MLKFKTGVENKEKDKGKRNLGDANFEEFFNLLKEDHDPKFGWRKSLDIKGDQCKSTVYQRKSKVSPIDTIWMDIRFENCKLENYLSLFTTGPPIKSVQKAELVKQINENESILHIVIKKPIMDPRE